MEDTKSHLDALYERLKTYTNTTLELYKLKTIDTIADIVSSLASRMTLVLMLSLFTLFISIAASLYVGELLGQIYLGFLIVSLVYLLIAIVLYVFGKKFIQTPVTNLVIAKLLKTKLSDDLNTSINNEQA